MKIVNSRLLVVFLILCLVPIGLILRLFHIQLFSYNKLNSFANKQLNEQKTFYPLRGIIFDRNHKPLAINVKSVSIAAIPRCIEKKTEFAQKLSSLVNMPVEEIHSKLKLNSNFVWIKRQMLFENPKSIEEIEPDGLIVTNEIKRYYPYKELTSHIVGTVGIDGYGLSGIESLYDGLVKRKEITETYKRDGLKREIKNSRPIDSNSLNIVLSIDSTLQYIAYKELQLAVKQYKPKKGWVIMQNPNTGEILALVCYPSFDPNDGNFNSKDLLNPTIHEVFEPGSTFKIVPAAAALVENKFKPDDIIYCENGKYIFADTEINDHVKRGALTFEGVMAYSSNIGFAKIGIELGREKLYYWIKQFGFGNYTGSNLPGEQRGIVHTPHSRRWSRTTTPNISFGQGIAVTGLQLINAYSAIANGGLLLEPIIIKSFVDNKNNVVQEYKPRVIRRILPEEVSEKIKVMLEKVVEYGTGELAQVSGYKVCGKTGTAQKIDPKTKKYSMNKYISSFCGFLPKESPQLTILIVLDEPETNYWASVITCPVFSRIAEEAMNYLNIPEKGTYYSKK